MDPLIGKWRQKEGQPYAGLWFAFDGDGQFTAEYQPMGIVSSGSYVIKGDRITMQQTAHTLGLIGEFKGLFAIDGNELTMALAAGPGQKPPGDLNDARIYIKVE
jgi:hypothetical protein